MYIYRLLLIFASFIFLLSFTKSTLADDQFSKTVADKLSSVEPISVNRSQNVKFHSWLWNGMTDSSFSYKIAIDNSGQIYIMVEVVDDKVIFKDTDTIISDHIEIWFADPRLSNDVDNNIKELQVGYGELKTRLEDPQEDDNTKIEINNFLPILQKNINQFKNYRYYAQLIFNRSSVSTQPEDISVNGRIFYQYKITSTGYQFFATLPLYKTCSLKDNEIKQLDYLIDLVDIDDEHAVKQKTLLSSSVKRVFNNPATFNEYKLANTQTAILPLTFFDNLKKQICPTGHLMLINNDYQYVYNDDLFYIGYSGMDAQAFSEFYKLLPIELKSKDESDKLKIYKCYGDLILVEDDKYNILNLLGSKDLNLLFQQTKSNSHYILLSVSELSKGIPRNGYCGAGEEIYLIWLKIGDKLAEVQRQSELIESCLTPIVSEELDSSDSSNIINLEVTDYRLKIKWQLNFNNSIPEKGIIKKNLGKAD